MSEFSLEQWQEFFPLKRSSSQYKVERWSEPYRPNPATLCYKLASESFDVSQWVDRPGTLYGMHKHPEEQSHWIISGQLEVFVNGAGAYLLGPGDRDFMPPETWHSARVIGNEPVLYLVGVKRPVQTRSSAPKPKRKSATKSKLKEKPAARQTKTAATKSKRKSATKSKKPAAKPSAQRSKADLKKPKSKPATKKKTPATRSKSGKSTTRSSKKS